MIKIVDWDKNKLLRSELTKKLYDKLIKIRNKDWWVLGIIYGVYDDDKKVQKMIDIIDGGERDLNKLTILSTEIDEGLI